MRKVPVLCVHGDALFYHTATVELRIGPWQERSRASNLPVDVLLGNDICPLGSGARTGGVLRSGRKPRGRTWR